MNDDQYKEIRLNIRVPIELKEQFYKACDSNYVKPASKIRELMSDYIKANKK